MAEFPNRIRELRSARNWSLETLAQELGCSRVQVSELERGIVQLTVDWMQRIAFALDVTPGELLLAKDNPLLPSDEAERELLARYRAATPDQKENLVRVSEALVPYRAPEDAERAA